MDLRERLYCSHLRHNALRAENLPSTAAVRNVHQAIIQVLMIIRCGAVNISSKGAPKATPRSIGHHLLIHPLF